MDPSIKAPLTALETAIRQSPAIRTMLERKAAAYEDATNAALLDEYARLQTLLQTGAMLGRAPEEEDTRRFQQIASLLMISPNARDYILSQLAASQTLAEVMRVITEAVGITMPDIRSLVT